MPKPATVSLLWVVSFISMLLPLLKTRRRTKMSACMSYVGIIFQPRLIALFSSFYCQFTQFYNILKVGMPKNISQSKDAKKWPTDANFKPLASTGRKVEMTSDTLNWTLSW